MAFEPKFTITNQLLANITRVHALVAQISERRFPSVVVFEFERTARAVSAYASTSIEGNPLPLTEVKKILKNQPDHVRDSEREVLNYNAALEMLNAELEQGKSQLTVERLVQIQKQITDKLLPAHQSGHVRSEPVLVNDPRTGKVAYIPPDVKDVQPLIDDLLTYISNEKGTVDPLILAGLFHKQFVLIHPFIDGNGRTTRLATKVLLAALGLDTFKLFSFENYYNHNITRYFQTVGEYGDYYEKQKAGEVDFTSWLEYFTEGIIDELLRVQKLLPTIQTPDTTLQPYHHAILDIIKEKGFATDKDYAERTERAKATRALDLQKLVSLGLIEQRGKGRATYYVLREG